MITKILNFLKKPLVIASLILVMVLIFFFTQNTKPKCPDDYANDNAGSEAYVADTNKWTNDFFDNHPGASMGDWAAARHQFWIDNNCVAALQRYEDAKNDKADPETMNMIDGVVRKAVG